MLETLVKAACFGAGCYTAYRVVDNISSSKVQIADKRAAASIEAAKAGHAVQQVPTTVYTGGGASAI